MMTSSMKSAIIHHKLLTYGLNKDNSLAFIEDVPNGLACGCVCPCCKEPLIAKNMGKKQKREHHFAHSSGSDCQGYYETTLHLLSKEIIRTEKAIMVPNYESLESQQIEFEEVEVEERNDCSNLQPDCVGITKEGLRLHIEIFVTHQIDDFKKSKIKEGNINCIEIKIPNDFPLDKELLKEFILNSTESREWINYPYGDWLYSERQKAKIIKYRNLHPDTRAIHAEKCETCVMYSGLIQKKYDDFINSYINRIHAWAIPIAKLSPQEIYNTYIVIQYTKRNKPYVWYNDRYNWIYPKDEKYTDTEHKIRCKSTYGFFKNLFDECSDYLDCMSDHRQCQHFKKQFEYKGQWYVFCSFKPKKVET